MGEINWTGSGRVQLLGRHQNWDRAAQRATDDMGTWSRFRYSLCA